tara:strand:+ start:124403 stop:125110 length:708 start_codon:yes stop_codon:yes gene_type:complete
MNFNPEIHHRRSIRLKGYDYASEGLYFITICVRNHLELLGEIINEEMILNEFGEIAQEEWAATPNIRENITLGEFQIMPNHIHGIIQINFSKGNPEDIGKFKSPSQTIGAIIRGFKGAATKRIKNLIRENRDKINYRSTGESQFAPIKLGSGQTSGESQFAPIKPDSGQTSGESQFAPTDIALTENLDLSKSIWQRDYYEIIIRDSRAYNNISNYIINNPKKWAEDKFYKTNKRK